MELIVKLNTVGLRDQAIVGGKNASLGEMIQHLSSKGIKVPSGFATTTDFYRQFIAENHLQPVLSETLSKIKTDDITVLNEAANYLQSCMQRAVFSAKLITALTTAYEDLNKVSV
ncbi:MAG: phosphoenolpyruvate synthase, partial [Gammaproteobacteria bacterium]|nr:phosphoenolpyruvate synthase [Gammaproteobacteria bacterium]